jgi:REDY-like protein HapK
MDIIVHRIRLHDGADPARFEAWVRDVDYATCPELPSVLAFSVQRADAGASFDFFEIIQVTSREEFERDMGTQAFAGLVADFEQMASVVEEFAGSRVEPGYTAAVPVS